MGGKKVDSLTSKQNKTSKQKSNVKSKTQKNLTSPKSLNICSVQPIPMEVDETANKKEEMPTNHSKDSKSSEDSTKLKCLEKPVETINEEKPELTNTKPSRVIEEKKTKKSDNKTGKKRKLKEDTKIDIKCQESKKQKSSPEKVNILIYLNLFFW